MRVKICGIRNKNDIDVVIKSDADAAGFLVGQVFPSPDFILPSTAARLADELPPYITPVLVTHLTEPTAIKEIAVKSNIFTIQLHGGCSLEGIKQLNKLLPSHSKLIFAAHIINNNVEPALENFYPLVDAILLDSFNKDKGAVGGTGQTHNWAVSAEIVKTCPLPIILAGGLNPDNVTDAIKTVKPFGVDANSCFKDKEGNRSLPVALEFVKTAKLTAFNP